jgi:hypothetical protein
MGERAPGGDPGAAMAPTSSPCSRARTRSQSLSCVEEQSHAVKYVTSLCATCTYAGTMCSLQASVVDLGGCSGDRGTGSTCAAKSASASARLALMGSSTAAFSATERQPSLKKESNTDTNLQAVCSERRPVESESQ